MPTEFWRASVAPPSGQLRAEDCWGAISHQAQIKGDVVYAELARHVSVTIQAAGIRLRDVAKGHHAQLEWALQDGKAAGASFKNTPLLDLYLDFHSLAAELCAARDHLANVAARAIGAKDSINSMPWLVEWLAKPVNAAAANDPMIGVLLNAWGNKNRPGWLQRLGDLRNQMLHRQPMASNPEAAMLRLVESTTDVGRINTIRLAPSLATERDLSDMPDFFASFLDLYNAFERLAREVAQHAKYPARLVSMRPA